jgi:hypothetical protein
MDNSAMADKGRNLQMSSMFYCDDIYQLPQSIHVLWFKLSLSPIFFFKNNSLKYEDTCPKKSAQMIKF